MDSKHPPAQQLLPRLSPLLAPASHATSGRAGRCAAPWRPAPRMPRRPAPYLAAGGRSRKERGASRWWWRGPFPRAQSASHAQGWLVLRKVSRSVADQCSAVFLQQFLNAGVLVALHPRTCSTQFSGSFAAPSFLLQIPVQTQLWVHQARSPEFATHNRYEVYPQPMAQASCGGEESQ